MRVVARTIDDEALPEDVRRYVGQRFLTPGKGYDVHALSVFDGVTMLQIVDDIDMPSWQAARLFDVDDGAIPADWICTTFHAQASLVLGPRFIAESLEAYGAMVELEPEPVAKFWSRVKAMADGPHDEYGAEEAS